MLPVRVQDTSNLSMNKKEEEKGNIILTAEMILQHEIKQ